MAEPTITDVYERLGGLGAKVDDVRGDLADARHDREKLAAKVADVDVRTAKLEQTMKKLEPTVDSLADLRKKALGGIAVIVLIFGIVGWLVGLFLTELKTWLVQILGGR